MSKNIGKNINKNLSGKYSQKLFRLRKVFANNSLANVKLSKNQGHKLGRSGTFLGRRLGPLL